MKSHGTTEVTSLPNIFLSLFTECVNLDTSTQDLWMPELARNRKAFWKGENQFRLRKIIQKVEPVLKLLNTKWDSHYPNPQCSDTNIWPM